MEKWRWIPYQTNSAAENMAIDEAIMIHHRKGKVPPTIRFYGWETPTCSIGYFQKIKRELDLDELIKQNVSFVRRITGGRTVFHDQELTYSLIVSDQHPLYSSTISKSYYQISQGLLTGFRELGLVAELAPPRQRETKRTKSSACFDLASDYELVVQGKKVVGSAQTRKQGVLLQHGSILIDLDTDRFFRLLQFPSEAVRYRMKRIFAKRAGSINQLSSKTRTLSEVIDAFYHGFQKGMKIYFEEGELTFEEAELAKQLVTEKYDTDEWNLQR